MSAFAYEQAQSEEVHSDSGEVINEIAFVDALEAALDSLDIDSATPSAQAKDCKVRLEVALAEAARFKEEARETREAAITESLEEAELLAAVEKNLVEATEQATQENSRMVARLWAQNENSKRRAELVLDEFEESLAVRRGAAESAIAAAADDRLLSNNEELQESRLAALQARLDIARRSIRESYAARTALEDREAANQRMEFANWEAEEEAEHSILAQQELHAAAVAREDLLLSSSLALQEEALAMQLAAEQSLQATREEISEEEAQKSAWAESATHAALEEVESAQHEAAESLAHFQRLEASEEAAEEAYRRTATTLRASKANADEVCLTEERAVRVYSETLSEAKLESAQVQECCDRRREQARLKMLETEAKAHEEQEQRVLLSKDRWQCGERRAEAAAERCREIQEAGAESEAKQEYDIQQMREVGDEQESEALKLTLAVEAILSKSANSFHPASSHWPGASESTLAASRRLDASMDLPASPFTPPRSVVPAGDETTAPTSPMGVDAHSDRSISPTK